MVVFRELSRQYALRMGQDFYIVDWVGQNPTYAAGVDSYKKRHFISGEMFWFQKSRSNQLTNKCNIQHKEG